MDPEAFRAAAHDVVDRIADYLATIEALPGAARRSSPGRSAPRSRSTPPERPGAARRRSSPTSTAWSSRTPPTGSTRASSRTSRRPRSGPGMLGEFLTAALGQNPMLWRTSPIGTELETVVVGWLREALGLPDDVRRPAHRHRVDLDADRARGGPRGGGPRCRGARAGRRRDGSASRASTPRAEAHSLDREGVHDARARAGRPSSRSRPTTTTRWTSTALGAGDRRRTARPAARPVAIVATIGTTSSTSVDPVAAIADVAAREGLWLHVDAAYAGAGRDPARAARGRSPAGSAPTRSSSTRTSGCSRRSTPRCC